MSRVQHLVHLAKEVFRNGVELHERRALVYLANFRIAEEFFHWGIFGETDSAKDFHSFGSNTLSHLRSEILCHGGLCQEWLSSVFQASRVIDHEPCGLDLSGHLGELKLHGLKL